MIDTLISSKTRIKLLLKFFLNSDNTSYLRGLEEEFGESTNAIRVELNRLEEAGLLTSELEGNKKIYKANRQHPLYSDIHSIMMKYVGLDGIAEYIVRQMGDVKAVYLGGSLARGLDGPIIDLIIVGEINKVFLVDLIERAERIVKKKIRYITYSAPEFEIENLKAAGMQPMLLWKE